MTILDCVQRTHGAGKDVIRDARASAGDDDGRSGTSDEGDSDSDDRASFERQSVGSWSASAMGGEDDGEGGDGEAAKKKGGIGTSIKQFRSHQADLNRRHRGLMQWKAARNVVWAGHTVQEKGQAIGGRIARPFVGHRERQFAVDSEV